METFDIILRGGATSLLALLSMMLLLRQPNRWIGLFGSLLFLGVTGYLWAPVLWASVGQPAWSIPLYFAGHCITVFFWLFALSVFEDDFRPNWVHAAVFTLVAGMWFVQLQVSGTETPSVFATASGLTLEDDVFVVEHLIFLAVVVTTFIRVGAGISTDLVEGRRRLRGWVIGATGAYILLVIAIEIFVRDSASLGLHVLNAGSIFVLIFLVCVLTLTLEPRGLIAPVQRRPAKDASNKDAGNDAERGEDAALVRLKTYFEDEKGHHREGLTIALVAEAIDLPEYRARRLINQRLGFRNFNALLNEYRIKDACNMLSESENTRLPVLTIALDVGYGSIGPFNRAFKELMGMTPTEFRRGQESRNSSNFTD